MPLSIPIAKFSKYLLKFPDPCQLFPSQVWLRPGMREDTSVTRREKSADGLYRSGCTTKNRYRLGRNWRRGLSPGGRDPGQFKRSTFGRAGFGSVRELCWIHTYLLVSGAKNVQHQALAHHAVSSHDTDLLNRQPPHCRS